MLDHTPLVARMGKRKINLILSDAEDRPIGTEWKKRQCLQKGDSFTLNKDGAFMMTSEQDNVSNPIISTAAKGHSDLAQ